MKTTMSIIASLVLTAGAAQAAPNEVFETTTGVKVTIYDASITTLTKNARGDFEVNYTSEYVGKKFDKDRFQNAATCAVNGGYVGILNDDGSVYKQAPWVPNGPSLWDQIATHVCIRSIEKTKTSAVKKTGI
jgi:hypothetical protein